MIRRTILAILAVFITWSLLDFVIHNVLLKSTYEATAELWRPMAEMKISLMYVITFLVAVCFVAIYGLLVGKKSLCTGLMYGTLFGLSAGLPMGFGSYSYMPIPLCLAWSWMAGTLVEMIVAGALVGLIMRSPAEETP